MERGEAQRQNLEYEMAVLRKEAEAERNTAEARAASLSRKHSQLQGESSAYRAGQQGAPSRLM